MNKKFLLLLIMITSGCIETEQETITSTTQSIPVTIVNETTTSTLISATTSTSTTLSTTTTVESKSVAEVTQVRFFNVLARNWYFDPNVIEVNMGDKVILNVTARDNNHGFGLNAFKVNIDIHKDETVLIEFIANQSGNFTFYCTNPACGPAHKYMKGKLVVNKIPRILPESYIKTNYTYTNLTAIEFKELVDDYKTFVLDVHIPEQRHIKGTDAFVQFNQIQENIDKLPKDKNTLIAVYCRTGSMSEEAAKELVELGYKNVYNLAGGINSWKTAGYELE